MLGLYAKADDIDINFDINKIIINDIVQAINNVCDHCKVVALPYISPWDNLTGYMIEGWWGSEANLIDIPKLKSLISPHKMDLILVIAPAKYYVTTLNREGVGVDIFHDYRRIKNPNHHVSIVYTMFLRDMRTNKKILTLDKQVLHKSLKNIEGYPNIKNKSFYYTDKDILQFKQWIMKNVSLEITKKAICFLNLRDHGCSKLFLKPNKPWYYMSPH